MSGNDHRLAVDLHDVTIDVHAHRSCLEHPVGLSTLDLGLRAPPQHRTDPGDQLAGRVRLGDVVVGSEFETDDLVDLAVASGHHDDRDAGARRATACRRPCRSCRAASGRAGRCPLRRDRTPRARTARRPRSSSRILPCAAGTRVGPPAIPRPRRSAHSSLSGPPYALWEPPGSPGGVVRHRPTSLSRSAIELSSSSLSTWAGMSRVKVDPVPGLLHRVDLAVVVGGDVLDDRETQTGAAGRARPGLVDAEESFEHALLVRPSRCRFRGR